MVVEGEVGATTSKGREVVVGEAVMVQGGLMDGRGVDEGVDKGGRPCCVRTIE